VTARDVEDGEELCIFYGHNLWFEPSTGGQPENPSMISGNAENGWGGLLAIDEGTCPAATDDPYVDGDPDVVIAEEQLPFTRFKLPPDEEDFDTIRTGMSQSRVRHAINIRTAQAWVVDIPDQQLITRLLK